MTMRYRDLPAEPFAPPALREVSKPEDAQWGHLSIGFDGQAFLSYFRNAVGSTILTGDGERLALSPPDRDAFVFPMVQRFSDGRWLVVEPRTRDHQPNAFVFLADRSFSHAFYAGDGVETVLVNHADRIWIGYFDEGVFGGHGDPATPSFGPKGLVRLSENGELEFGFNGSAGDRFIGDIYAITIDDKNGVWLCPYEDFFVASIDDRGIHYPLDVAPVAGAAAMAVGPRHLVFFGGYNRDCMVTVVERETQRLRLIQLLDGEGGPLSAGTVATRGTKTVALADDRLYRLDLELLLEALGPWHDGNSSSVDSAVQYMNEEGSYAGYSILFAETGEVREYTGKTRPPENQPRDDDCG